MKYKKTAGYPKNMLKDLAEDISRMIDTNEGRLLVLETVEDIPYDIRNGVLESLSSFYRQEMVWFFHLLKLEYGKELETICSRALEKYRLAGLDTEFPPLFQGSFYKAYGTCSRHTGRMTVDVAWKTEKKGLHVECFFLTFNSDGVHSFFVAEDMPVHQYEQDRQAINDMVDLSYKEVCMLVKEAFKLNMRFMSRPALGRFLYQKYLDEETAGHQSATNTLLRKVSARLAPRQLVNSLFHALRCQDFNYMLSITAEDRLSSTALFNQLNNAIVPGTLLLEGQVEEVRGSHDRAQVTAYAITLNDREVYKSKYLLHLFKEETGGWLINNVESLSYRPVGAGAEFNPFAMQVFCRVYEIISMDDLFEALDQVDDIREVEELPYGMHMRVTCLDDDFNHGVSLMTGVIADMVINGEEFVVISQDQTITEEFHYMLTGGLASCLIPRGEYEIGLTSAYSYLSGQYINFEDILLDEDNEVFFEDGMRFITARYVVKDRDQVLGRLQKPDNLQISLPGDYLVFYQCEDHGGDHVFQAEYVLGPNWLTISAFGEKDMSLIRQCFEKDMFAALEFDGLEVREEGIFEILSTDVKRHYPELETLLKEMYLNKWYYSRLSNLSGMSPSEACQTEEGTRLLWAMFKKIKQKEKKRYRQGERLQIGLKEYMRHVDLKKRGGHKT